MLEAKSAPEDPMIPPWAPLKALKGPSGAAKNQKGPQERPETPADITTERSGRKLNETTDQLPYTIGSNQLFD